MLIFPPPNKAMHWDGFGEELADAGLVTEIFAYADRIELPGLDEGHRDQVLAVIQAHAGRPPRVERARQQTHQALRTAISELEDAGTNLLNYTAAQRWEVVRRLCVLTARILRYLLNEMREE